jgi:HAD superfamily hydrolase (TIGR01509 family)
MHAAGPDFAAVAWDVDGTLVDSEPRHHRALLSASRSFGVPLDHLPDQAFRGVHMHDVWKELGPLYGGLDRDAWLARINADYVADPEPMQALPGAVEAIEALAQAGIPQICVSNSNRPIVLANLSAIGVVEAMAGIVTLDDVIAGKPHPAPYRDGCALLGLHPGRVVAVEDSTAGLRSAQAAGLFAAGYAGAAAAPPPGADLVLRHLSDIVVLMREGVAALLKARWSNAAVEPSARGSAPRRRRIQPAPAGAGTG